MFEHFMDENHIGFSIEVLQVASPGEDLRALEDLWIATLNPTINDPTDWKQTTAVDNLYIKELLLKLEN